MTPKKRLVPLALVGLALCAPSLLRAGFEEKLDVAPGETLEIDLETGGSLEISGWDLDVVRIATGSDFDRGDLSIERTASGVRVEIDHGWRSERKGRRGWRNGRRLNLTINVPLRFDLDIETMGGEVAITDVEGRIQGETMGGNLRFSRLTGRVDFETMGGSIELTDSEVDGELETMGGRVEFRDVVGDIKGSSMGGNVVYKNVTRRDGSSTGDRVVISTMGGKIEVDDAPAGAELDTMGGQIRVGAAREFVKAETMGGNISVGEIDGWLDLSTMGGDVEATMVGDPSVGKRDVDISSMGGEIDLVLPAALDMTVEIELTYTKKHQGKYSIESDFPLQITEDAEWDYHNGSARKVIRGIGTFGTGRNRVRIDTINGDVRLKSGS